jgi:hypothetical protein
MFISDPATANLVFTALACAGAISLGLLSLCMLPWTDAEIEEVDQSAQLLTTQLRQRALHLGGEPTLTSHRQMTSAMR